MDHTFFTPTLQPWVHWCQIHHTYIYVHIICVDQQALSIQKSLPLQFQSHTLILQTPIEHKQAGKLCLLHTSSCQ